MEMRQLLVRPALRQIGRCIVIMWTTHVATSTSSCSEVRNKLKTFELHLVSCDIYHFTTDGLTIFFAQSSLDQFSFAHSRLSSEGLADVAVAFVAFAFVFVESTDCRLPFFLRFRFRLCVCSLSGSVRGLAILSVWLVVDGGRRRDAEAHLNEGDALIAFLDDGYHVTLLVTLGSGREAR